MPLKIIFIQFFLQILHMLQKLFIPLYIVYKLYVFLVFVMSLIILYPAFCFFLKKRELFPLAFKLMRYHANFILLFSGVRLKIEGIENIPKKGPYIVCPNHSSFLDIFCIYSILETYFVFTGKREIEKWPLFRIFYTSGMNILVDRNNNSANFQAFKRMNQEIESGNPLIIFPEGTISRLAPKLAPFKPGAFLFAIQKQIPVIPITFVTNWELLQRSNGLSGKARPGISKVIIHKPIITTGLNKSDIGNLQSEAYFQISLPLSGI